MADGRRGTTDVLDGTASDRATIIDGEPVRGSAAVAAPARGALASFAARRLSFPTLTQEGLRTRSFPLGWTTFVGLVIAPAIAVVLYFAFVASNQYIAEMRLVVRVGRLAGSPGLSNLMGALGGGGGAAMPSAAGGSLTPTSDSGTSLENAHIVTSYIHSRAIVDELLKTVDLREMFSRPEADFYARLSKDASVEDLVEYWQAMVRASLDQMSGIVTVHVRAFRPEDAVAISQQIEVLSERLVNEISQRARADALRRATEEVERAQGQLLASFKEMERYRNREGMIDPIETAKQTAKLLAKVLGDQLEAENQLFITSRSLAPDAPAVRNLTGRVENLRRQVAEIRAQMAGSDAQMANYAGALARYEEVMVRQKLALTLYTMAENGLERARIAAEAQSVYLSVFVKPSVPEDTLYPKRLKFSVMLIAAFFVAWSIAALIWASIQDHRLG